MAFEVLRWFGMPVARLFVPAVLFSTLALARAVSIGSSSTGNFAPPVVNSTTASIFWFNPASTRFNWGGLIENGEPHDSQDPLYEFNSSYLNFQMDPIDGSEVYTGVGSSLGKFTYFNGNSTAGTGVDGVSFVLSLYLDGAVDPVPFAFPVSVFNRTNNTLTEDDPEDQDIDLTSFDNADDIIIQDNSVDIGGGLELTISFALGDLDPDLLNDPDIVYPPAQVLLGGKGIRVLETNSWTFNLIAKIGPAQVPTPTPESGATFALLASAFALLGCRRWCV